MTFRPQPEKPTLAVVFSYWPLLSPSSAPPAIEAPGGQIMELAQQLLDQYPTGEAKACLWLLDSRTKEPSPCLVMPNAKQIAKHLRHWAEDKPIEWFKLYIAWREDNPRRYALLLFPDIERGMRRWIFNQTLLTGDDPGITTTYTLFQPLRLGTENGIALEQLRFSLPNTMTVYLVEADLFDPSKPEPLHTQAERLTPADRHKIASFPFPASQRGPAALEDKVAGAYLKSYLDEEKNPTARSWINPIFTSSL